MDLKGTLGEVLGIIADALPVADGKEYFRDPSPVAAGILDWRFLKHSDGVPELRGQSFL